MVDFEVHIRLTDEQAEALEDFMLIRDIPVSEAVEHLLDMALALFDIEEENRQHHLLGASVYRGRD